MKEDKKLRLKAVLFKASLYTFVIIGSLIAYGYAFPSSNNIIEVPPVLSLLDPELYQHDYYVQDTLKITPRYYYQHLIYFLTKLGISLPFSYLFCWLTAFSSFIFGCYALGKRISGSYLSAAVIAFLGLVTVHGTIGHVSLFRAEPIPAVFAMGCAIWGIYFCFANRWIVGYLFFGIACLLQFLIGLLPGILMAVLLLTKPRRRNKLWGVILPFFILGLFASLIYVPMIVSGSTSSGVLNDAEFIKFHGYIRQPHHIIPSSWAIKTWVNFVLFMIGGILCIRNSNTLTSENKKNLLLVILISLFTLFIGWFFVEVYPLAIVAKLQFARTTPFIQLMVIIAIAALVDEHYRKKNLALSILLITTPLLDNGGVALFLTGLSLTLLQSTKYFEHHFSKKLLWIASLGSLCILAFYSPTYSLSETTRLFLWKFILFLTLASPFFVEELLQNTRKVQVAVYILAVSSFVFLTAGLATVLPRNLQAFFENRVAVNNVPTDGLTKLALRFQERSSKDALVLVPPSLNKFRFYSQRSVVFTLYGYPFTEQGLQNWATRGKDILGSFEPPLSWRNSDEKFQRRRSKDLIDVAKKYKANYILTNEDWHSELTELATVVDRDGKWILYRINRTGSNTK